MSSRTASPAIRASLRGHDPSDEQWAAIEHPAVPLAIIAGAGAGKTAIMAARIVWMVEEEICRPSQILGLTFTNKAALELEERIVSAFSAMDPEPHEHPTVSTYNSFADRLVREYGVRIGIDPEVGLLSQAQSWQLLLGQFDELPPFDAIESRSMASIVRNALSLADACANHLVDPVDIVKQDERILGDPSKFDDDVIKASRQRIELARVVQAYTSAKTRAGRIDFGDQVTQAVKILDTFPEVVRELRERYPALLLDEYQDTNVAQRRLLQALAPHGHNVTAVGDARQNIFQWRGSTLFNLLDFPRKHFLRDGGGQHDYLSLSENFRSGSSILAVANRIIEPVPVQRRPGRPLRAVTENGPGALQVKLLSDQYAEGAFIADEIAGIHGSAATPGRSATDWSDFAILVRRKAHIAPIYAQLKQRDIPVEVVGLSGLLQVPEVVDAVAWLRVLADPGPNGNRWLARILMGPRFRIHYRDLALLARWAQHHNLALSEAKRQAAPVSELVMINETEFEPQDVAYSLVEALDDIDEIEALGPEARSRLVRARHEILSLRSKAGGALLELVQSVISGAGIGEALDASSREDAASAKANLTNFLGVVASFAPISGEPSIDAFLAYLDAAEDVEETLDLATPAAGNSVKLMTVHQAKGLEFEVVFVPCVAARANEAGEYVDSFFPDVRTSNPMTSHSQLPPSVREDAEHLPNPWTVDRKGDQVAKKKSEFKKDLVERAIEDERRLFYVAITRAKQLLYVTAAWWYERQRKARGPSQFFSEVAECPETDILSSDEMPQENPLQELLARQAVWPPDPARSIQSDDVFPDGYPAVVDGLMSGDLHGEDLLALLKDERGQAERLLEGYRQEIAALLAPSQESSPQLARPVSLSATQAVALSSGSATIEQLMRPVPQRPSPARRIGTEIHRWIEEQARGLSGLADEESLDLPSAYVEQSELEKLRKSFVAMGYTTRKLAQLDTLEPMAEVPFVLKMGDRLMRGRIDAVYETEDGGLEIVDFKTGKKVAGGPSLDQLMVYAAALITLGVKIEGSLKLTYCYLATEETDTRVVDAETAMKTIGELERALAEAIAL